jgi:uncharacterized membrane protein YkgB
MKKIIEAIDLLILIVLKKIGVSLGRIAIFIVYFWFGFLKVIDVSPASPLITDLLTKTLPFIPANIFILLFGFYEMIIGIVFLIPGLERLAVALLVPHLITTFLPLVFLPQITWKGFLVPTLEGQYIIKNLIIIALAFSIASHLQPLYNRNKQSSQ